MGDRRRSETVTELQAALEADDPEEKNYHVRQALQLVKLDAEDESAGGRADSRS